MFKSNSRYANQPTAETGNGKGKTVQVVKLRRLPYVGGNQTEIKIKDRLDVIAYRKYKDDTKFWHIADANTEVEATKLVEKTPSENPLAKQETPVILVPEN